MRSKYDSYWAGRLEEIRLAVELAVAGSAATVGVPGLRRMGNRQSWSGVAEVRGCELTRESGAHAKSLGNTVATSGICSRWEEVTFRLVIGSAGVVVMITRAERGQTRPHRSAVDRAGMQIARGLAARWRCEPRYGDRSGQNPRRELLRLVTGSFIRWSSTACWTSWLRGSAGRSG